MAKAEKKESLNGALSTAIKGEFNLDKFKKSKNLSSTSVKFKETRWMPLSRAFSDTQAQYEVEVGTTNNSNNIWDPSVVTSGNHYAIYAGSSLTRGQLYYVRVRVYDGYEWSEW